VEWSACYPPSSILPEARARAGSHDTGHSPQDGKNWCMPLGQSHPRDNGVREQVCLPLSVRSLSTRLLAARRLVGHLAPALAGRSRQLRSAAHKQFFTVAACRLKPEGALEIEGQGLSVRQPDRLPSPATAAVSHIVKAAFRCPGAPAMVALTACLEQPQTLIADTRRSGSCPQRY
jgi:hypothetical protein